jgi:hypothetical protein
MRPLIEIASAVRSPSLKEKIENEKNQAHMRKNFSKSAERNKQILSQTGVLDSWMENNWNALVAEAMLRQRMNSKDGLMGIHIFWLKWFFYSDNN